jgi:hypothetical protein
MSRRVRWLKQLAILVTAIAAAGLALTLLVRVLPAPHRGTRERVPGERPRERREFRGPQVRRGSPEVLKQIVIVGVIALLGRKVLRIRL